MDGEEYDLRYLGRKGRGSWEKNEQNERMRRYSKLWMDGRVGIVTLGEREGKRICGEAFWEAGKSKVEWVRKVVGSNLERWVNEGRWMKGRDSCGEALG